LFVDWCALVCALGGVFCKNNENVESGRGLASLVLHRITDKCDCFMTDCDIRWTGQLTCYMNTHISSGPSIVTERGGRERERANETDRQREATHHAFANVSLKNAGCSEHLHVRIPRICHEQVAFEKHSVTSRCMHTHKDTNART
jgi:hypothetical protein